jgi:hypothetical protein
LQEQQNLKSPIAIDLPLGATTEQSEKKRKNSCYIRWLPYIKDKIISLGFILK